MAKTNRKIKRPKEKYKTEAEKTWASTIFRGRIRCHGGVTIQITPDLLGLVPMKACLCQAVRVQSKRSSFDSWNTRMRILCVIGKKQGEEILSAQGWAQRDVLHSVHEVLLTVLSRMNPVFHDMSTRKFTTCSRMIIEFNVCSKVNTRKCILSTLG